MVPTWDNFIFEGVLGGTWQGLSPKLVQTKVLAFFKLFSCNGVQFFNLRFTYHNMGVIRIFRLIKWGMGQKGLGVTRGQKWMKLWPTDNAKPKGCSFAQLLVAEDWYGDGGVTKGGTIARAPIHYRGTKSLRGHRKVPRMSQVLSSIHQICSRKTSGSNMGASNLFLAPCAI